MSNKDCNCDVANFVNALQIACRGPWDVHVFDFSLNLQRDGGEGGGGRERERGDDE